MDPAPVAVGLLTPYFAFFEPRFPASFRAEQAAYADGLAAALAAALERVRPGGFRVVPSGLVDGPGRAAETAARFGGEGVRVVVAAPTMAAPPTWGNDALAGFAGPVVLWDDRRAARYEEGTDEVEATRWSGILGSIMLGNVLGRNGRRVAVVSGVDGDADGVARAVAGAAAAARLRGARLGLLGGIIPGYGDVVLDPEAAAGLGIELVPIGDDAVAAAMDESRADDGAPIPGVLEIRPEAAPLLDRSRRIARFLRAVARDARLDALALNCHSAILRNGEELGAVGCLGATLLAEGGLPVACTGDAATTVALLLAAGVAGSAQYGEVYAIEHETGEAVISSCGMADRALCGTGVTPRLHPNELYPGRHGEGVAIRFAFEAGPATLVAYGPPTPLGPARLVVATGALSGRGFRHMNGPSGTLAIDRPGSGAASAALIGAAPAHHVALVRGDRRAELRAAASFLPVELVEIGRDAAAG